MKKLITVLITILLVIGAIIMNNKDYTGEIDNLTSSLSNSYFKLSNYVIKNQTNKIGLSDPTNVGVDKTKLDNEVLYNVPSNVTHVIDASEFGVNGTDFKDDTLALIEAINHVKSFNNELVHLILPSGDLDFIEQINPQNRQYGIVLKDIKNLIISGDNTNIYFHGETQGFLIENCENLLIKGINIDWGVPPFSTGVILENDGKTFTVQVNSGYKVDENTQIKAFLEFNKTSFTPRTRGNDIYCDVDKVEYLGNNQLRITFNSRYNISPSGTLVVLRHYLYEYDCFFINNSSDIKFESVNLYSAPGMGVRAYSSGDLYFNRFNTMLKPNTDRLMSVTADSLHFINCYDDLVVTNSIFENAGDDALNTHGAFLEINNIINDNTFFAINPRGYNFMPKIGDILEINNSYDLGLMQTVSVKSIVDNNPGYTISVNETLANSVDIGNVVGNVTRSSKLLFANNLVRNKRCRGVLVQTRDSIIENNTFANLSDAGILVTADANNWYESITTSNLVIRNNKFLKNNFAIGNTGGDIAVSSYGKNYNLAAVGVLKNYLIENNFFGNSANSAIYANSIENLTIRNNLIYNVGLLPKAKINNSGIYIAYSKDIELRNNNVIANSSSQFKALNIGASVNVNTVNLSSNIGFSEADLISTHVNLKYEAIRLGTNQTINLNDNSLNDWYGVSDNVSIAGISDVDQNEHDFDNTTFKINALKVAYDDNGLYLAYDVFDNELMYAGSSFWEGDGVEIFITTELTSLDPLNVIKIANNNTLQLFMNPTIHGNQVVELRTSSNIVEKKEQIKMVFTEKNDGKGYIGKVFIPFTVAGGIKEAIDNNQEISFVINFSDLDSTSIRTQYANVAHPVEFNKYVPGKMSKLTFMGG